MQILPLSEIYREQAIALCNKVFPDDVASENPPELGFRASLDMPSYKDFLEKYQCTKIQYYVLLHEEQVIGTSGIYQKEDDPSVAWLGWFCIDPNARGKGYGEKLLEYTLEQARQQDFSSLALYTDPEESQEASRLYHKFGFSVDKMDRNPGNQKEQVAFLSKKL